MILDSLANIGRYRGMHKNLDTAIDYLLNTDIAALPDGRVDIDGDRVFMNIASPTFFDNKTWEKHRKYADIQIALMDGESIGWAPEDDVPGFSPYDEEKGDIQQSNAPVAGIVCALSKGVFGLYFPHDAHRPGIGNTTGRKAVVKVRMT